MSNDERKFYKEIINMLTSDPEKLNVFFKNMMNAHHDDEDYWSYICENTNFTLDFIKQHHEDINIKYLLKYQKLDDAVLLWMKDNITFYPEDMEMLVQHQNLSEDMITYYIDKMYPVDWDTLACNQAIPPHIIEKYAEFWDWGTITTEQFLTLELIEKYSDKIRWNVLPLNYHTQYLFNDSFVRYFKDKPIWENIGLLTLVTVECLLEFKDRLTPDAWISILTYKEIDADELDVIIEALPDTLDTRTTWDAISTHQTLDAHLIDKYADKLNWDYVSAHQKMDWDVIERHHERVSLYHLSRNECVTPEMIAKIEQNAGLFKDTLDKDLLSL